MNSNLFIKDKNTFINNSFYLYLSHFSDYILALFLLPFIARTIGAIEFGEISLAQTFGLSIILFMEFGSTLIATRKVARIKERKSRLKDFIEELTTFKIFLIPVVIIASFIMIFFVPVFSNKPHYIIIVALGSIFQGISPSWYFQGIEKMKKIALSKLIFRLVSFALIVLNIKSSNDGWIVLASFSLSSALICAYLYFELVKKIGYIKLARFNKSKLIFKKSISSFLITLVPMIYQNISIVILSFFVNPFQLGFFFGASRIHRAFNSLYSPISQAFFPKISSLNNRNKAESEKLIKEYFILITTIGSIFFLINYLFAENLISILLGNEFVESKKLLRLFSFILPLTAISNALGRQWMIAINKEFFFSIIQIISSLVALIILLFLIDSLGVKSFPMSLIFYEVLTIFMILIFLIYSSKG